MKHWEERRKETDIINCRTNDECKIRTNYERDFARVVHSAAFRRLQAKTQVLGMGDSDFHRTRLTHSMEVSQIGVAITKKLYRSSKEESDERAILPPPMLMSTICLAHDLGHPPFGHGGEVALNRCMLPYGGFEGNGQTLRIATKLEPYVEENGRPYGMDLTRRAVLGLIKYPAQYKDVVNWELYPDGKPKPPSEELNGKAYDVQLESSSIFVAKKYKPPKCYLNEEHDDVVMGWVAKDLDEDWSKLSKVYTSENENKHKKTKHKSLDTSIMELADDIAYGVHDLEDAISLGLIRQENFYEWFNEEDEDSKKLRKEYLKPFLEKHNYNFDTLKKRLFEEGTHARKRVIGQLVGYFVECAKLEKTKNDFKNNIFVYQAVFSNEVKEALDALKDIVNKKVIKNQAVQQLEFKGQKIVTELFNVFATDPKRLLSEREFKKMIQGGGNTVNTPTPRVICDYIAGMTDEYATKRYQQLFEPRFGSVFDRL